MNSTGRALCEEHLGNSHTLYCVPVTKGRIHIIEHYISTALMSLFEL